MPSERTRLIERSRRKDAQQVTVREHRGQPNVARARFAEKGIDASNHMMHRLASGTPVPQRPRGNLLLDLGRREAFVDAVVELAQSVVEPEAAGASNDACCLLRASERTGPERRSGQIADGVEHPRARGLGLRATIGHEREIRAAGVLA